MQRTTDTAMRKQKIQPWLALVRPPNLFTVPGDVVAGFFLARSAAAPGALCDLAPLIGASLCLYAAGLILNDWFDLEQDRRERPGRPIPSGKIRPDAAAAAALALMGLAFFLAAASGIASLAVAFAVAALVLFYNGGARRSPLLGFTVMGLCRGANLLLGASPMLSEPSATVWVAAATSALFVTIISIAAFREAEAPPPRWTGLVAATAVGAGLCALLLMAGPTPPGVAGALLVVCLIVRTTSGFGPGMPVDQVPPRIGALIRCLIPLQAAFVMTAAPGALAAALLIYVLWPPSRLLGRRFSGS